MPIRQASYADLLAASHVATRAFWDEELFGHRIHPYRSAYPSEMYLFFLRQLRKDFFDPRTTLLVSYAADLPQSVTGMGVWTRKGPGGAELEAQQPWLQWFTGKFLVPLLNRLEAFIWPNRAADPRMSDVFVRSAPFTKHHWSGERVENWYLALCGISPAAQGKGYGKELVRWGIEQARQEGIHASLIAVNGKDGFYRKLGFTENVGWASEGGVENPLHDVPGGMIMFTKKLEKQ